MAGKVQVRTPNVPGYTHAVDAEKYQATRATLLKLLPRKAPGLTQAEMTAAMARSLPQDLFPQGAKAMWWTKCVQLDLEARGLVVREVAKPLRWHRT